jgi:putative aminopeptidase FrvX
MKVTASLPIDTAYLLEILSRLVNTPSPTGLTGKAVQLVEETLSGFPNLSLSRTRKGALAAAWDGEQESHARALAAHVDTLGAMVKEIKPNGRLKMTKIGGFPWTTVEGEGCTVFRSGTPDDAGVRGSILIERASTHVFAAEVSEQKREDETMEVRLDALTTSAVETEQLGVQVGDFISFDPRLEIHSGFVRSRHLDDKACVACILAAVKALHEAGLKPARKTYLLFNNYEEVSHGAASGIPRDVDEVLIVDMAAVGEGQTSDEHHASLCVKDSGGPYHHEFSQKLRRIAGEIDLPYKVDIYPYYSSDGTAFWRAGGDAAVALIGPGVDASHSYERTHTDALLATTRWLVAYLLAA